jgi:hypothetical protein
VQVFRLPDHRRHPSRPHNSHESHRLQLGAVRKSRLFQLGAARGAHPSLLGALRACLPSLPDAIREFRRFPVDGGPRLRSIMLRAAPHALKAIVHIDLIFPRFLAGTQGDIPPPHSSKQHAQQFHP